MSIDDVKEDTMQFESIRQRKYSAQLGIWIFFITELLLFGSLFLVFIFYRWQYPVEFAEAAGHLDVMLGALNTALLLTSGLLMLLAQQALTKRRRKTALVLMFGVAGTAATFLSIKVAEWYGAYSENLVPLLGFEFRYPGPDSSRAELFFNFYFAFTGLHALHLLIGLILILIAAVKVWRWRSPNHIQRQTATLSLYWAFIDIIWILMFTLLYLLRA